METKIISFLKKIVSINSVYPHEEALMKYLEIFFKNYKITKQYVEKNRYNLLVEKGEGKKSILLYSHLDSVNVTNGWLTNPFNLKITNDKAHGLGAWDMKSGMTVNIFTFLNSNPKNIKLKLAFCVDEENISKGGHTLINSPFMKDVACVISTEPAFMHGLQGIITGRIGRAVLDVKISGESKHFAFYKKQFDINLLTAEFITQISQLNKEFNLHKKQFIFARKIESLATGMSIPGQTLLQLDCAILPPLSHKKILDKLQKIALNLQKKYSNNFKIEINFTKRETPFLEPYEINQKNKYLKILSQAVEKITKKKAHPYFRSSVADENIFGSHKIPTLGIGPVGANAHAPNEWVSIKSMFTLYKIINHFLSNSEMI